MSKARTLIESEDKDELFDLHASYLKTKKYAPREAAALLPVGAVITFNRWAAQAYYTVYWRVATYEVVPRKSKIGNYLKLINAGYGSYPYLGGKYSAESEGRVVYWPDEDV